MKVEEDRLLAYDMTRPVSRSAARRRYCMPMRTLAHAWPRTPPPERRPLPAPLCHCHASISGTPPRPTPHIPCKTNVHPDGRHESQVFYSFVSGATNNRASGTVRLAPGLQRAERAKGPRQQPPAGPRQSQRPPANGQHIICRVGHPSRLAAHSTRRSDLTRPRDWSGERCHHHVTLPSVQWTG